MPSTRAGALDWLRTPLLIFVAAVAGNVAAGAFTPLLESVSMRLSERFDFDYGHVRLWASALFVAGNVLSGMAVSRFGLVVIVPWLIVSLLLNLVAVWRLPAPPANRPRSDFAVSLRDPASDGKNRLPLNYLLSGPDPSPILSAAFTAGAGIHLHLNASFGNNADVPSLGADLDIGWNFASRNGGEVISSDSY